MKFVRYDGHNLGLLTNDGEGIVDLTEPLDLRTRDPLKEYLEAGLDASEYADADPDHEFDDVDVNAPIRRPNKIIGASANYQTHIEESRDLLDPSEFTHHVENLDYFLKASSSVVDPGGTIELPFSDTRTDHELELALVVGEDAKDVSTEAAWDHVFGYSIMVDVSIRGNRDRSNRKSYDTFSPFGPVVVTSDEIDEPPELDMELAVNGDVRQATNTRKMLNGCEKLLCYASISTTVEAGDVIATGTPGGVAPLAEGDVLEASIEGIGDLQVDVTQRPDTLEERLP